MSSRRNRIADRVFKLWAIGCTLIGIIMLGIFLVNIAIDGLGRIDWEFITSLQKGNR